MNSYSFPTEIHVGSGARNLIPQKLKERGMSRPLIVTDRGVAAQPFLLEISQLVGNAPIFSEMGGNPVLSQVKAGLKAFKETRADSLLAVGGGAPIDVAKAIALLAGEGGELFDYAIDAVPQKQITGTIPPIAAVPTTAGTGSEVGRSAVISEDESKRKRIMFSPLLLPKLVFADPELLVGLPAHLTAATGMDALTHLTEAFLTPAESNPLCDGIALEGLRIVSESLLRSVTHPKDLQAREGMLNAALMGAVAFQKGLGANHSCAHALSTVADLHHGLANGVMLPFVMRFNASAAPERFARLALAVGASKGDFTAWIEQLGKETGIPPGLQKLGVGAGQIDRLASIAFKDPCTPLNPRPVSEKEFKALFEEALS